MRPSELHEVLQVAMGWENAHLHEFVADGNYYGRPELDDSREIVDEQKVTLGQLLRRPQQSLIYEYDFGDGWEHEVVLEQSVTPDPEIALPVCLAGERACPPEDVGGSSGVSRPSRRPPGPRPPGP